MASLRYSIVDAFTATCFKGNPAAVVILDQGAPLSDTTLQLIAAELNVPNTAFITPVDASAGMFHIRWFTPKVEVALCGHATLASASVLFSHHDLLPENVKTINFMARENRTLQAQCLPDGRVELQFPASAVRPVEDTVKLAVEEVIRRAFQGVAAPRVKFVGTGHGIPFENYILIDLDGVDLDGIMICTDPFRDLAPQYTICVLTHKGHDYSEKFVSRVFCPAFGIPEDSVSGSVHCMLGPYWAERLQIQDGAEMIGRQASARSGQVGVVWARAKGICSIRGHAALVANGALYLPK